MKRSARILACVISAIFPLLLCAQEPVMLHYTKDDGLPSNTVYNVYSDSKGYLWFGTDKGAARYNGTSFKTFTTDDGLPDNEIFSFKEDYEGRLWLATFNGRLCYYKDGTFHNERNTPWLNIPKNYAHMTGITVEKDSSVTFLFGISMGLIRLKGERITLMPMHDVVRRIDHYYDRIVTLIKQPQNTYKIITWQKSIVFDQSGHVISETRHAGNRIMRPILNPANVYLSLGDSLYDADNKYICQGNGLTRDMHCIAYPGTDEMLIGTRKGLYFNGAFHIKERFITALAKDFQGNTWVSTLKNGIYQLGAGFRKTGTYMKDPNEAIEHALRVDKHLYYINNKGAVKRERPSSGFETIFRQSDATSIDNSFPQNRILPGGMVILISRDSLMVLSDISGTLKPHVHKVYNPTGYQNILSDGERIYFIAPEGISKGYTADFLKTGALPPIPSMENLFHRGFSEGRIYTTTLDKENNLWFPYRDSVFKISDNQLSFMFRQKNAIFRRMLVQGSHFIAFTEDNLLLLINRNREPAITDTIKMPSLVWDNMYLIDDTHVFLTNNKYYYLLTLMPQKDGKLKYQLRPVEQNILPQQAEYIYIDSVYSFFFKNTGITRIETSLLLSTTPSPRVGLTELRVRSRLYTQFDTVHCTYPDAKDVRLRFDAISFSSKELGYQYSISENNTDHWQDISGTEVNLPLPSYGLYTIKVRAKTISSDYSAPASMTLIIGRPWWATWWFWAIAIATFMAMIWGFVRWRTRRLLAKKQQEFEAEKRYQQAEYKALNALMNPHFIFNSMNNIQGLINEDEKQTANDYLVIFSEMIRQNMHNIDLGVISLQKELTLCRNYLELEKLRFKDLINFSFEVEEDIDTEDIDIPPLLIQPLIENAIRHGLLPRQSKDSMVTIRITEKGNLLTIEVEDNGIGLNRAAQNKSSLHQSTGISNMQKRIAHIRKMKQKGISFSIAEIKNEGQVKGTLAVIKIELE